MYLSQVYIGILTFIPAIITMLRYDKMPSECKIQQQAMVENSLKGFGSYLWISDPCLDCTVFILRGQRFRIHNPLHCVCFKTYLVCYAAFKSKKNENHPYTFSKRKTSRLKNLFLAKDLEGLDSIKWISSIIEILANISSI